MHELPLSQESEKQEIITISPIITQLNNGIKNQIQSMVPDHTHTQQHTCVIFEYNSSLIRKITNIPKHTNLCSTFCSPNTLTFKTPKENVSKYLTSGIYS